jgi:hypothetical protein
MKKSIMLFAVIVMLLAACQPAAVATEAPAVDEPAMTEEAPAATEAPMEEAPVAENPGLQMDSATVAAQFFNDEDYATSLDLMTKEALNPDAPLYLQYLVDDPTDITKYQ